MSPPSRTAAALSLLMGGLLAARLLGPPSAAAAERLEFGPIVANADFPTNLAFAPDGRAFFTEKDTGRIRVIDPDGRVLPTPFATLPVASDVNEMGLLGLALPPDFAADPWVYAYYSDARDAHNHLVRIRADGDTGGRIQDLLTLLPTENGWHNGGDIAFGPDGRLYVVVGDGHVGSRAQDPRDLGGKVLRLNADGSTPPDNPFGPDSPAFAIGIRNSFGLCFGRDGTLWETENGTTEWDELNRIEAGGNYGWPAHLGPGHGPDGAFVAPVLAWRDEIVPTGCAVARDGSVYVGDYRGVLHRIAFPSSGAPRDQVVASFGAGITDVEIANGRLYVTTDDAIYVRTGIASTGPFTPAGIVILLVLVGLLLFFRRRLGR